VSGIYSSSVRLRLVMGFGIAVLTLAVALPLRAAEKDSDETSNEALDQRLKVLERKLELAEEAAAAAAKGAATAQANDGGFRLRSANGAYEIRFRGTVQVDYRAYLDDDDVAPNFSDTFILRRFRPTMEATFGKIASLRITPEFAGGNATVVDAWLDLKVRPWLTLRLGKQKEPVGLERLQSAGNIVFVERAFPNELVANRDIGLTAQGDFAQSTVSYQLGIFNGAADGRDANATDVDDSKELVARVFLEPFRNAPGLLQGLGVGLAGSHGKKAGNTVGTNGVLPQLRSPGQNTFFQYLGTVVAAGEHDRRTAQTYYYRYGLGVMGEYVESAQEVAAGPRREKIRNDAWQLSVSYVLTGEDNSFRGVVRPKKAFGDGGSGAFELAARVSELNVDDAAFPFFASSSASARRARAWALGLNWYANANAKLQLTYGRTGFEAGAAGGGDREAEKILFGRFQLVF
jgi:phosphate-selective porin OprO and OprP